MQQSSHGKSGLPLLWTVLLLSVLSVLLIVGSLLAIACTAPAGGGKGEKDSEAAGGYDVLPPKEPDSGAAASDAAADPSDDPSPDLPSPGSSDTSDPVDSSAASSGTGEDDPPSPVGDGGSYTPFRPEEKTIAITFDDGPSPYTDIILDKLEGTGSKVTFFVVGDRVSDYPKQIKRAAELGCEIGSHTYSHTYLTKMSEEELEKSLGDTKKTVKEHSGADVSILRPPGGHYEKSKDYGDPLIMWSVDTEDWKKYGYIKKGTMTEQEVIDAVCAEIVDHASSGAIVLLHDLYKTSCEAFCKAYDILTAQGYKFVTVSQMLGIEGKEIKPYVFFSTREVYLNGERVTAQ